MFYAKLKIHLNLFNIFCFMNVEQGYSWSHKMSLSHKLKKEKSPVSVYFPFEFYAAAILNDLIGLCVPSCSFIISNVLFFTFIDQ